MTQLVQTIILGLLIGGVYALLASGLTLIFGVMDVINVAQGALLIFAAFLTWWLWKETGIDPLLGVLITTPAMFLVGLLLYLTSVQWISGRPASTSVLLTFALALIIEGAMGLRADRSAGASRGILQLLQSLVEAHSERSSGS